MSIKSDLKNALKMLKGRGAWCTGDLKNGTAYCAVGAVGAACGALSESDDTVSGCLGLSGNPTNSNSNMNRAHRAIRRLALTIAPYADRNDPYVDYEDLVITYNDRSSNKRRVIRAFEKTIASL